MLLTSLLWTLEPDQRALFVSTLTKPAKSAVLHAKLLEALAPGERLLHQIETAGGQRLLDGQPLGDTPLRVLLAEDNTVNQKVAQLMLAQLGHYVDTVSDGAEALAAAHRARYDVVLMDMRMPHMDGLQATQRIREEIPADHQPLIVAMTANVLPEDREACLQAGMDGFLTKPIRSDELADGLGRLRAHPRQPGTASTGGRSGLVQQPLRQPVAPDICRVLEARLADIMGPLRGPHGALTLIALALLRSAVDELPRLSAALLAAAQPDDGGAPDREQVQRHAHTLKGCAANLGAEALAEQCRRFEDHDGDGSPAAVQADVQAVQAEAARVVEALKRLQRSTAAPPA